MYKLFLKLVLDRAFALFGIILLSPIIVLTTISLFIANQGKPFFYQLRPGLNGKIFKIIKFKTMNDKKDSLGNLLPDEKRMTKIGIFVRKNSIDEIPQLINVIIGDMSLIGPRPLLPEYLPLYNETQKRRHNVKPGITGWAQVNGRNAISWQQKFEYDIWYVDHLSFVIDIQILFMTVQKVFVREGINSKGQVTAEAFKGK